MQTTLCCTRDGRRTLHNGNRILSHHTPQSMCTVSVSLPPALLTENTLVAVAHPPTCQEALVFLLPRTSHSSAAKHMPLLLLRILLRHASRHIHQPTGTQSVNVTLLPRMMEPHTHQNGTPLLGASSVWTHKTGRPSQQQLSPSSEA
ncbi:hypothetical protein TcCL_Unassigned00056 [Trypanosoma cruzi]|nr:hypothetical protein TcCL_Unassigned00056 [Trypanosoma cruzi]